MAIPKEIEAAFFSQQRSDTVKFAYNDSIEVTSGDHAGKKGIVVFLIEMEPEIKYMLSLDDGTDIEVGQGAIKL
jgi:hypothetical protein